MCLTVNSLPEEENIPLQDTKTSPLETISSEMCLLCIHPAPKYFILVLWRERWKLVFGKGGLQRSRSCTPSWHRDLQPCSALPSSPAFFFLVLPHRWVVFWGGRNPLSALIPPWCHIQTAPAKVTSAELYLAAALIMHLNSQSGLAEMILSPNDVFPPWPWPPHPQGLFSSSKAQVMPAVGPEHHFRDAFSFQFELNFRNICEIVIELDACRLKIFHLEVQGWSAEILGVQEVGPCCAEVVRNPGVCDGATF